MKSIRLFNNGYLRVCSEKNSTAPLQESNLWPPDYRFGSKGDSWEQGRVKLRYIRESKAVKLGCCHNEPALLQ